jgi:hypothetical protein
MLISFRNTKSSYVVVYHSQQHKRLRLTGQCAYMAHWSAIILAVSTVIISRTSWKVTLQARTLIDLGTLPTLQALVEDIR